MDIIKVDISLQPYETLLALLWQLSKLKQEALEYLVVLVAASIVPVLVYLAANFRDVNKGEVEDYKDGGILSGQTWGN